MKVVSFKGWLSLHSLAITLAFMLFTAPTFTHAADSILDSKPFKHVSIDQHLKEVIEYFVSSYGVNASFSESFLTEGYPLINGQFEEAKGSDFLNKLASLYNLSWFFDGRILHVTVGSDQDKQLHRITKREADLIKETLDQMDANSGNFSWKYLDGLKMLEIYGQPAFLENFETTYSLVDEILRNTPKNGNNNLNKIATERSEKSTRILPTDFIIRSFSLKYASAEDSFNTFRGKESVSQGVVSRLRELFNVPDSGPGNYIGPSAEELSANRGRSGVVKSYPGSSNINSNNDALNNQNQSFINIAGKTFPMPPLNLNDSQAGQQVQSTGGLPSHSFNPISGKPKPYISYDSVTNKIIIYDERQILIV